VSTAEEAEAQYALVSIRKRHTIITELGPMIQVASHEVDSAWKLSLRGSWDSDAAAAATKAALERIRGLSEDYPERYTPTLASPTQ